jgi:predicted AAA+ superfamily ATPase
MTWTAEQLQNAMDLLWNASESSEIVMVDAGDESYLMLDEVSYTDELYVNALKQLVDEKKVVVKDSEDNRLTYGRA